ncbi:MAG: transposase [Chitinophagales bacterium]
MEEDGIGNHAAADDGTADDGTAGDGMPNTGEGGALLRIGGPGERLTPACPHCRLARVQKWGRFDGRQRYRCTSCAKTFTETTGTPLAGLKRPDRWAQLERCLLASLSVRSSAEALGVHPSTAFRWRHRFLADLRTREKTRLAGVTELTVATLVEYRLRLVAWGQPFRGVSAKYYRNYLAWFSFLGTSTPPRPR